MEIIYFTVGLFTKVVINIKKISKPVKCHSVKTIISLQYPYYLFVSVVFHCLKHFQSMYAING